MFVAFSGVVLVLLVLLHRNAGELVASTRPAIDLPVLAQPCGGVPMSASAAPSPAPGGTDPSALTLPAAPCGSAPGQDAAALAATTDRYYWSQCVKDETMAESIAQAFEKQAGKPGPIVHYNGAFHSDFGQGTAERVRRRLPNRRVAIVSMLPVADIDSVSPADEELKRADYLVYTVK